MFGLRSFRFQLLLAVNGVLGMLLAVYLVVDYRQEIAERVVEKHVSLEEEAKTLLPAVTRLRSHGIDDVQAFMDEVCGQMQEAASPGHHIAFCLDDVLLQAVAHHRASQQIFDAMVRAEESEAHHGEFGQEGLVVGAARQDDVTVYVSEYLTNIRAAASKQVLRRVPWILLMAVVAGIMVNVVFLHMAARPLARLVETVRSIGKGNLGLQTQPFRAEEFRVLADAVNAMSSSLAEMDRHRQNEMERARRIQESVLPKDAALSGLDVAHLYEPAEDVAADYYDVLSLRENTWLVCIADVMGHGVPAAMSAMMLKTLLLHAAERESEPNRILEFINERMTTVCQTENLATMFVGRYDQSTMVFDFASAGHDPGLLLRVGGALEELRSTGILLGAMEDATWDSAQIRMESGDRLFLATDGVPEAFSPDGEMFGRQRLIDLLTQTRDVCLSKTVRVIGEAVSLHQAGQPPTDDVTVLAVEFKAHTP
jgi:phosphoserine phosphatase RsbU/P